MFYREAAGKRSDFCCKSGAERRSGGCGAPGGRRVAPPRERAALGRRRGWDSMYIEFMWVEMRERVFRREAPKIPWTSLGLS